MKKLYVLPIALLLILSLVACQDTPKTAEDTTQTVASENDTEETTEDTHSDNETTAPTFPDTWYDFSSEAPILNDAKDSDTNDIKNVYVAHDNYYIYVAFEVETNHVDSTTMIMGAGTCIFVGVDMPGYFSVDDQDKNTYADNEGNGDYYGQATYKYENSVLQIRVPLSLYDGATEFKINTLFRKNIDGGKTDADTVEDFIYTIDG